MPKELTGLAAAVDIAMENPVEVPADRPEQLALLPEGEAAKRVQAGRPAGAVNKSTREIVEWIGATGEHPLMFLAKVYRKPVLELARELSCSAEKAMNMQIGAAAQLAPYIASKQPLAVQVNHAGEVALVIVKEAAEAGALRAAGGLIIDQEDEPDQTLSEA